MLHARNSSFSAFAPARQFRRSAYSWPAALNSCSLATLVDGADRYFFAADSSSGNWLLTHLASCPSVTRAACSVCMTAIRSQTRATDGSLLPVVLQHVIRISLNWFETDALSSRYRQPWTHRVSTSPPRRTRNTPVDIWTLTQSRISRGRLGCSGCK